MKIGALTAMACVGISAFALAACSGGDGGGQEAEIARLQARVEELEASAAPELADDRLRAVRDRGELICAVHVSLPGFGYLDPDDGSNRGFDVDLCRAVAAAVLGDADAVLYHPVAGPERGPLLQAGEVDIVSRNTTWTSTRDATWGNFVPTMFYDGQGFMIPKSLADSGVAELEDLTGASVCVLQATTTEQNLQDFGAEKNLNFQIVTFPDNVAAQEAYRQGQCDAYTTDTSGLAAIRSGFEDPDAHVILPGTISEEPLSPVVPHGDEGWYDVVRTVMSVLVYAEAYGVTSESVPTALTDDTAVDRLFGFAGSFGQSDMGLDATFAQDVIRQVGNYAEIYDRNVTAVGVAREGGRNALWSAAPCDDCPKGGQIYAAPLR